MRTHIGRHSIVVALVAATLPSGLAVAQQGAVPAEPEATTQTITGRGFGHGRGMSQYGAQGAALAGKNVKQILDFYYPGTAVGKATGSIRIRVTADSTDGVRVNSVSGLKVRDFKANKVYTLPVASNRNQWSIDPHGDQGTQVRSFDAKKRTWSLWRTLGGMAQFEGPAVTGLILPSGAQVKYRGALRAVNVAGAHLDTVNVLPLEAYLRGVVPREAITSWRPAALQAQSVAARTYAAYYRKRFPSRTYDLCDTISCQVYGGYSSEKTSTNNAIAATAGQVRLYRNTPIVAEFSSSNGGATTAGTVAYQVAKADSWDAYPGNKNPNVNWSTTRTSAQLQKAFGVGKLKGVSISRRTGLGPGGGRVTRVVATGAAGTRAFTGDQVRANLNLKSAWFVFGG
ncbi:SpoIID/LytB domain-containing protein [Kribbella sp. DT2]|uniref:SpoIID/LytB domain-containing protein n=1 Tax=Kribbella sp. DT2 TaxID=3393427 RepID=UPI003CEB435E